MPLISLNTNLKSLRYGHDKSGGGSSNQPYIISNIPDNDISLGNANTDFLLRGGILAPADSVLDVIRLSKYFSDLKSPSGLLFVIKQNLLSRVAARTQASGLLNENVYSPLSTLAQAGVNFSGLHLNKQGLNPFPGSIGSLITYSDVVGNQSTGIISLIRNAVTGFIDNVTGIDIKPNRLVALTGVKINGTQEIYSDNGFISLKSDNVNLFSYPGGPGSILGIGNTYIKLIDGLQRTGVNNSFSKGSPNYLAGVKNSFTKMDGVPSTPVGASKMYDSFFIGSNPISDSNNLSVGNFRSVSANLDSSPNKYFHIGAADSVYSYSRGKWGTVIEGDNEFVFTQQEIIDKVPIGKFSVNNLSDFRNTIKNRIKDDKQALTAAQTILSNSPDYSTKNIETRINLGDPGSIANKNITSYTSGSDGKGYASVNSYDKINSLPLYRSEAVDITKPINDLIKFRIAAIDNDDPSQKVFIHFRAFINGGISDGYSSDIGEVKYTGRGESFYNYSGFSRKLSLSFIVAAQSKFELIPMYQKLNYLASQLAPDYSKFGYMRGPLIQLTIGGYLYEQVGYLQSLTLDLPEESPWEIGINDDGNNDETVKELPHIIKVNNFSFLPIHSFVPKKGQWDDLGKTPFIALSNGINTNY